MVRKLFVTLEDETPEVTGDLNSTIIENNESQQDVDDTLSDLKKDFDALETALAATDDIENTTQIVQNAVDTDEPLTETTATLVQESIKVMLNRVGLQKKVSVESFSGTKSTRMASTKKLLVTLEEEKEGIWAKIVKFLKMLMEKVKDFFAKLFGRKEQLQKQTEKTIYLLQQLEKEEPTKEPKEEPKEEPKGVEVKVKNIINNSSDMVAEAQAAHKMVLNIVEKIPPQVAYLNESFNSIFKEYKKALNMYMTNKDTTIFAPIIEKIIQAANKVDNGLSVAETSQKNTEFYNSLVGENDKTITLTREDIPNILKAVEIFNNTLKDYNAQKLEDDIYETYDNLIEAMNDINKLFKNQLENIKNKDDPSYQMYKILSGHIAKATNLLALVNRYILQTSNMYASIANKLK